MTVQASPNGTRPRHRLKSWVFEILLIYILIAGAYFRYSGIFWGEYQYLHPDERFLVWVGTDITPVKSIGEYFNTSISTLNPHNVGKGFYVYGTFPMFVTRYIVQWIFGHSGFDVMTQVGRMLSALLDLFTVVLVYLAAGQLYDKRVGILAAAFSAAAVLQIQQSHFFTMDTFLCAFMLLAFYFAARVLKAAEKPAITSTDVDNQDSSVQLQQPGWAEAARSTLVRNHLRQFARDPLFSISLGFGVALGLAASSKLDAAPMAMALPLAFLLLYTRIPARQKTDFVIRGFLYLVLAAIVSLVVFRIFQPYAFSGPGFFGIKPNPLWVNNIRELIAQSSGDVDFPPAMQWARRPRWFSLQNMVLWGMGLPYGILAWSGFLWVGWRILRIWKRHQSEWTSQTLLWTWTAAYFVWQSMRPNSTMRYQLPIYPMMAIFAGWALVSLYDMGKRSIRIEKDRSNRIEWKRVIAVLVGCLVLLSTYGYAYAFSRIYTRPITRIEASRWIYQNIPGPINLVIQTNDGLVDQPIPFPYNQSIVAGSPYSNNFQPWAAGSLQKIYLPKVVDLKGNHDPRILTLTLLSLSSPEEELASISVVDDLTPGTDGSEKSLTFVLDHPITLDPSNTYRLKIDTPGQMNSIAMDGNIDLGILPGETTTSAQPFELPLQAQGGILRPDTPLSIDFTAPMDGYFTQLTIGGIAAQQGEFDPQDLTVSLLNTKNSLEPETSNLLQAELLEGGEYRFNLEQPLALVSGEDYVLRIELWPKGGKISLSGSAVANEGEWDDGLPVRLGGLDGFGGIYTPDLNFNMYWDDNPEKLARFVHIMDQTEYILISSNRQWGTLPRIPERFPMTTIYYRDLLGCPEDQEIGYCYSVARPGMYAGKLGFELIKTFQSDVVLGPVDLNDQFAEEAFTVYDHPKVLIFKKTSQYDSARVQALLERVDFSKIIRMPPMRYPPNPANLMLPTPRWAEQQHGGTWSSLFNTQALYNRIQPLGVVIWYLAVSLIGLMTYPLLKIAFPGLADGGYPMARTAGMLVLSYLVWLAGSIRIPFDRLTITIAFLCLLLLGGALAYLQRKELLHEWNTRRRYFLLIEALTLGFFVAFLLVRLGNPDLWHQWKGGEKPMDFSYFNAVLKSTSFPPYDPWYEGGYLNYYYFGFVFVGVLTKWLGIVPSFAYNLILPTIFSLIAMGAFSIAWNLAAHAQAKSPPDPAEPSQGIKTNIPSSKFIPAIAAAMGMALLGNLGTVRMIFQGFQKIVAPDGIIEGGNIFIHYWWALRGFIRTLQGAHLPYSIGDWYWIPSRAIPAPGDVEPITEFPYFTALYGDPHAHLFAMPIALLALAGIVGIMLSLTRKRSGLGTSLAFIIVGLAVGALKPTNTWDFYPYLVLGIVAVGYSFWRGFHPSPGFAERFPLLAEIPTPVLRVLWPLAGIGLFIICSTLPFLPFDHWYALGYSKVDLWKGTHTSLNAYLTHWGLFLFVIISWMLAETVEWMAATPLSALRKLRPYWELILSILIIFLFAILGLLYLHVRIAWFVVPLMAWAGVLLLRPGLSDAKRAVLFLVGTGLALTLTVEIVVLRGDIGRMNTVFKFYLQVWTLFAVSAAAGLGWLAGVFYSGKSRPPVWSFGWRVAWQSLLALLVAGTSLYTFTATLAKIKDRMTDQAPHTLDGMTYMQYATYQDQWGTMDLSQDYQAIRWLQENVSGSPVIVEANLRDLYRWGSRISIYTGLPGVVGWEWHQQQQRAVVPGDWISSRIDEIADFYQTTDWKAAEAFLQKYDVKYIVLGQQERGKYPGEGLDKFLQAEGILWQEVYHQGDTIIFQVLNSTED